MIPKGIEREFEEIEQEKAEFIKQQQMLGVPSNVQFYKFDIGKAEVVDKDNKKDLLLKLAIIVLVLFVIYFLLLK